MDQESFRKLLQTPKPGAPTARPTNAPSAHGKKAKTKNADPAQPAFKPRTVKKLDQYRDRAGERRQGLAHDYAQVEALAEDFEKRNAEKDRETLEEQRKYLGGDSEHTVLVKGLDFALLEQNKARLAEESTVDDDVLEQAFVEGSSQVPKKRTREDIIRDLKNKRMKGSPEDAAAAAPSADVPLDDVKKTGKFKPIGFKPVGATKKKKPKAGEADGAPKKKKKKTEEIPPAAAPSSTTAPATNANAAPASSLKPAPPEPEPIDDDDDIFAGAGDYTGIEVGDDDDDDDDEDVDAPREAKELSDGEVHDGAPPPRRWVDVDEPPVLPPRSVSPERATSSSAPPQARESASPGRDAPAQADDDAEDAAPARLQPLASSAVPSIRELLAIDEAKEREAKRRARREKKKGKKTAAGDDSE